MLQRTVSSRKASHQKSIYPSSNDAGNPGGAVWSQAGITCDPILSKKIIRIHRSTDFLKISYWIQWDDFTFLETLDWLKKRMQNTDDQEQCIFKDCCMDWNLQRTGTQKFNYRLCSGDVTLLFNRREPTGTIPTLESRLALLPLKHLSIKQSSI